LIIEKVFLNFVDMHKSGLLFLSVLNNDLQIQTLPPVEKCGRLLTNQFFCDKIV